MAIVLAIASHKAAAQSDYSTPRGTWRGPAQFNLSESGQRAPDAHTIAQVVIEVQGDGRVRGVIPDVGCTISGLAGAFAVPTIVQLDVTLKDCRDARFNRRYSGTLSAKQSVKEGALQLNSFAAGGLTRKASHASVSAVMQR